MEEFETKISGFLQTKTPFLFIIDFLKSDKQVYTFEEAAKNNIFFNIKGTTNQKNKKTKKSSKQAINLNPKPVAFNTYKKAFNTVKKEILNGNSFLLNLAFPTKLDTKAELKDIYTTHKMGVALPAQGYF